MVGALALSCWLYTPLRDCCLTFAGMMCIAACAVLLPCICLRQMYTLSWPIAFRPPGVRSSNRTAQAPPHYIHTAHVPTNYDGRLRRHYNGTLPILFAQQPIKARPKITAHFERYMSGIFNN